MSALTRQPGGSHYKDMKIQPVEFITANNIPYREANVIKYACRHKSKNGVEDIEKAIHYLEMIRDEYLSGPPQEEDCKNTSADEGWIEWVGGNCPVSEGALVSVRYRHDGTRWGEGPAEALCFRWSHRHDASDIIAYRVVAND